MSGCMYNDLEFWNLYLFLDIDIVSLIWIMLFSGIVYEFYVWEGREIGE